MNVVQITMIFVCMLANLPTPLHPLQILFTNLATNGIPAIALSMEETEPDLMTVPPRPKHQPILHGDRLIMMAGHALALLLALFVSYTVGLYWNVGSFFLDDMVAPCSVFSMAGWAVSTDADCARQGMLCAQTMVFLTLGFAENLRIYTVRSFRRAFHINLLTNRWLLAASVVSIGLTLFVTLTPGVQGIFHVTSIHWFMWLIPLGGAGFCLLFDELIKLCLRSNAARVQPL